MSKSDTIFTGIITVWAIYTLSFLIGSIGFNNITELLVKLM